MRLSVLLASVLATGSALQAYARPASFGSLSPASGNYIDIDAIVPGEAQTETETEGKMSGFNEEAVYRATDLDDGDGRGAPHMPGWVDPRSHNGSMLDLVGNGMREPINVIISGKSDPTILSDQGLKDYVRTIGFSFECLNIHLGALQRADLGDGAGWRPEMFEYRQTQWPGAPGRWVGACWESLYGGNHFRAWKQNGTAANTGAWFLAVSKEKNLSHRHTISEDGYNDGRDLLVEAAERGGKWKTWTWRATTEWADGLLEAGRHGINHNISQDGRVAILTVYRVVNVPFLPGDLPLGAAEVLRTVQIALTSYLRDTMRWMQSAFGARE